MGITKAISGASKAGFRGGWTILAKFRIFLMFFFFIIIFINTFIVAYEARDATEGIRYLGEKFLMATENLGTYSREVIEEGGVYDNNNGMLRGLWGALKHYYYVCESFFIIYIWIKVLTYFILHFVVWDSSKQAVAGSIAMFFFLMLQMIVVLAFTDKPMLTPINSFVDFFKSLPYLFKPVTNIAEKYTK